MNWFREYKNSLKMAEVEELVDLIIYRPLAFLLVISIFNTKIKPDHLTLAAMVMGIIGGFCYSSGTRDACIAGSVCYLAFNILDCSDGQLARIKKNGSSIGRLLDGIADYIAAIAVYIGIAIGFSGKPDQPSSFILLVALAGISIVIQESLVDYFRTRFLDVVLQRQDTFDEGMEEYRKEWERLKTQNGLWFSKFVVFIYLVYSEIQRKLAAKKKKVTFVNTSSGDYFKKNHIIIRFWVLMGPSAKITTLIICSLFMRFDIFFWIVIGGFNILALLLWIIQYRIDKNLVARNL
jgi:phosphatidylglycerophosphate synthase